MDMTTNPETAAAAAAAATHIQAHVRKWIVQSYFRLRKKLNPQAREPFINDTDFYTLERLDQTRKCETIGIMDSDGFVYGFLVYSFLIMYNTNDWISNPYNRKSFSFEIVQDLFHLLHLAILLFPDSYSSSSIERKLLSKKQVFKLYYTHNPPLIDEPHFLPETVEVEEEEEAAKLEKIRKRLTTMRQLSFERRVEELFIEMDIYGNYTQSGWFKHLSKFGMINFFNILREIWYIKTQMSEDMRVAMCPFGDPFQEYLHFFQLPYMEITRTQVMQACIHSMENMIYTSPDMELRKLGCLYIISALTVVSIPARLEYFYLFESIL